MWTTRSEVNGRVAEGAERWGFYLDGPAQSLGVSWERLPSRTLQQRS